MNHDTFIMLRPGRIQAPISGGENNPLVTVVVPVKDDPENLRRCLIAIPSGLPILVVESSQNTAVRAVTEEHGAQFIIFNWDGQFPKKRNWVLQNYAFTTPWVLFIDADEYPTDAFWKELETTLPATLCNGFWLNYHNHFMGKRLRHGDPCPKLALFRVGAGEYERIDEDSWSHLDMEVHEHPLLQGSAGKIQARIDHQDFRGLSYWITKHNAYSDWEARRYLQLIQEGQDAWNRLTLRQRSKYCNLAKWWFPYAYFFGAYIVKRGFLDGVAGFRLAKLKAYYFYSIRLKIKELGKEYPI